MSKIVTITFSPCIDKSTAVAALVPDKKLQCAAPKLEPGGGGINVARAIKKLGGEATAIFPSGGYTGKYFNHLLEQEKIPSVIIETQNETRENIIVLDEAENAQYRFGMPGTSLSETECKKCLKAVEEMDDISFLVASGSLPPGVPHNIYALLAKIAKNKGAKFIVDTSGKALKEALEEGVYLLKPNLGELCFIAGKEKLLNKEIAATAMQIINDGGCEVIVVSMGAEGAMIVTKEITEIISAPSVIKKSTVGAGDSMVAGIVYYLFLGNNIVEAVKYGIACGTAATMNTGTELCKVKDVEMLYNLIQQKSKQNI
ncbi:MAG: 1-phosphofructokinase family hexose kinase [Ferruginibacter sp.]|nr:1-phosphofructokinase family hexose kinase [Ferruginibacter sp.]